ncbi:MMPL family transporter [Microbispora cellulosiformans]|uniref:MMPL family transporter n=1 Tax=Microbispora cellulosiformans TaxID=2614688 RepID=A0A5J5K3K6_9ACTN|nr:MMPL family transporter [Microbispora cellulosiformans]
MSAWPRPTTTCAAPTAAEGRRGISRAYPAAVVALRRALPSVAASAATMALAAPALLAADMNATKDLGPLAAIAVLAATLVMTTLLPALLTALGRGVFWPAVPCLRGDRPGPRGRSAAVWERIGALVSRRPRRTWVITARRDGPGPGRDRAARLGGGHAGPRRPAARGRRPSAAARLRPAVVGRRAGRVGAAVPRPGVPPHRPDRAHARLPVPGGARRGLHDLPDGPGPRGGPERSRSSWMWPRRPASAARARTRR